MLKRFDFDLGDKVFTVYGDKVVSGEIEKINYTDSVWSSTVRYHLRFKKLLDTVEFREGHVFRTRRQAEVYRMECRLDDMRNSVDNFIEDFSRRYLD